MAVVSAAARSALVADDGVAAGGRPSANGWRDWRPQCGNDSS